MNMNISFPSHNTPVSLPVESTAPSGTATKPQEATSGLTVTEARVSDLDATEAVPDSALRRDDPLGRLVSAVFSFAAPPMPAFPDAGAPPISTGLSEVRV